MGHGRRDYLLPLPAKELALMFTKHAMLPPLPKFPVLKFPMFEFSVTMAIVSPMCNMMSSM